MKTVLIGVGVAIIIIAVFFSFVLLQGKSSVTTATTTPSNIFGNPTGPSQGGTQGTQPAENANGSITITTADGSPVSVPDFTKTNQLPSSSATNGYQVASSPQENDGNGYDIIYFTSQSYFDISILSEPIGQNRLAAEAALASTLGLSDSQLCSLNVQVYVQVGVNDQYSGRNLGLSFCPGSVQLPN